MREKENRVQERGREGKVSEGEYCRAKEKKKTDKKEKE